MNPRTRLGLGLLVVGLGTAFALSGPAHSQPPPAKKDGKPTPTAKQKEEKLPAPQLPIIVTGAEQKPFTQRLAAKWNVNEAEVARRLEQMGQEIQKELAEGRNVEVPSVGTLRVVTVHQHRETVQGRPAYVEKRNTVQLVPVGGLVAVANGPGAKSMEEILPGNYFYHDIYTGNGLNREPPYTYPSGRDMRPANTPSNKVGGRRIPEGQRP